MDRSGTGQRPAKTRLRAGAPHGFHFFHHRRRTGPGGHAAGCAGVCCARVLRHLHCAACARYVRHAACRGHHAADQPAGRHQHRCCDQRAAEQGPAAAVYQLRWFQPAGHADVRRHFVEHCAQGRAVEYFRVGLCVQRKSLCRQGDMNSSATRPLVAIACGGTGGHLFPGLAVAEQLTLRGCDVTLLVSPKEIDRQAVKSALERRPPERRDAVAALERAVPGAGAPLASFTLPAVGLQNRNYFSFAGSFLKSFFAARKYFKQRPPAAVLAMGGFTSAPPVLAARKFGAKTFLHESNTIPGKANRFLSRFVDVAFVGFPEAAAELSAKRSEATGTPVRPQFSPAASVQHPASECRRALGLEPERPTVLVVGGSQGARGLNEMILATLPWHKDRDWQGQQPAGAKD